jgi:aspartyl aminopeptidase
MNDMNDSTTDDRLGDLRAYLDGSPSPYHAVQSTADRLIAAGFSEVAESSNWVDELAPAGFVVRDGALIAWRCPDHDRPDAPLRLVGAHTDSPGLRVKPRPDASSAGWKQLGVEVYGGVLSNSWLDRDLGCAGRVVLADGSIHLVNVDRPIARVPQLAIHLDRNVNESGLVLDKQQHLTPVWGVGTRLPGEFATWLGGELDADAVATTPVWWELCLYDVQPSTIIGADRSLLASGRLDNQLSCWAATHALARATGGPDVAVMVLNDHEEVGSASTTGASGAFLEQVLERLVAARGGTRDHLLRALGTSTCISADNAHAIHPNYPERHEPGHAPLVNAGPAIKVNANQRYATSAVTAARFQQACADAGVPSQVFVSRNNMPCGSTIGPLTATRLGIATVDVGVPQLSMHSARELCGVDDPLFLTAALEQYWQT